MGVKKERDNVALLEISDSLLWGNKESFHITMLWESGGQGVASGSGAKGQLPPPQGLSFVPNTEIGSCFPLGALLCFLSREKETMLVEPWNKLLTLRPLMRRMGEGWQRPLNGDSVCSLGY